jgi:prophage tail gpP-like protein
MPVPTGRTERRIAKRIVVELARPHITATAQNISERGMRLLTEYLWRPGELVQLSSPRTGFRTQARVIYCQHVENMRFAIGLELSTPLIDWTELN